MHKEIETRATNRIVLPLPSSSSSSSWVSPQYPTYSGQETSVSLSSIMEDSTSYEDEEMLGIPTTSTLDPNLL